MAKVLVLQHVAYEILGTLNPLLKKRGIRIRYVNFGRNPTEQPRLAGYQGLIVLGGPMNVDQITNYPHLKTEVELIKAAIDQQIPTLGICLGAQLIARALGAKVYPNPAKEIGWYPVSLTEAGQQDHVLGTFQATETIFQWHNDTFEIPKGAQHLASSPSCPNQAFRYADNIYGVQFHLEVDQAMIERWLQIPSHIEEIASTQGAISSAQVLSETPHYIGPSMQLSEHMFNAFIDLLGCKEKLSPLPSR